MRVVDLQSIFKKRSNFFPVKESGNDGYRVVELTEVAVAGGRMVIVSAFHAGGWGSIPGTVEMLGSVSVNHSLTAPRCENGTSECGEVRVFQP